MGRKGLPAYRLAVQEARRHPSSGRIVAYVGSFDPHSKAVSLDKEKIEFFLSNGAQPSPKVARLLGQQKIKLPTWVKSTAGKKSSVRHPEKLRKNRPAEPAAAKAAPETAEQPSDGDQAASQTES